MGVIGVGRWPLWALTLALLAVTWLGARGLDADTITHDEWWSVYVAGGGPYGPISLPEVVARIAGDDPWVTPGYFVLLSAWGAFAGWSDFAARAFSLFLGLLTLAMAYRLGRDMYSPLAGVGAALLMGFSAFYIDYLHEMRMYTLYVLCVLCGVWAYWRLAARPLSRGQGWAAALFAISAVGLLYTHYFGFVPIAAVGIYHLLFAPKRDVRRWLLPIGLLALAGLAFLPWAGVTLQITRTADNVSELRRAIALPDGAIAPNTLYLFSNGGVALFGLLALSAARVRRRAVLLAFVWAGAIIALAVGLNAWLGLINGVRYLLGAWPALALIGGVGLARLAADGLRPTYILFVWVASCLWAIFDPGAARALSPLHTRLPWDVLAAHIRPYLDGGDTLVYLLPRPGSAESAEKASGYYLHGLPGMTANLILLESPTLRPSDQSQFPARAAQIGRAGRLWVAYDPFQADATDHRAPLDQALIDTHVLCGTLADLPRLHLNLYAPLPDGENALTFGDRASLGVDLALLSPIPAAFDLATPQDTTLDALIGTTLRGDVPPYTYSVALLLMDERDQVVRQGDYGLPFEPFACHYARIDLAGLPPGRYALRAAVYQWQTGQRLPAARGDSGDTADLLTLWAGAIR
jgi:hypothetical protein